MIVDLIVNLMAILICLIAVNHVVSMIYSKPKRKAAFLTFPCLVCPKISQIKGGERFYVFRPAIRLSG